MEYNPANLLKFRNTSKLPLILQTEVAECGLACLGMVAGYHGYKADLISLRRRFSISLSGATLEQLMSIGDKLRLTSRALKLELDELDQLKLPVILHWDLNHFVVLKKVSKKFAWIHDPAQGEKKLSIAELSNHFTGIALEFTPMPGFEKKEEMASMPISGFWKEIAGLKRVLIQVLLLSFLLQVFALASPFFMQIVMDDILVSKDLELLFVVAGGFLLLALISQATGVLRSLVMMHLTNQLTVQMTSNLFHHLLRLPIDYFETRHLGDIVSRFGSLGNIRTLLTSGLIQVVLDGVMVITTLLMMFIYIPTLSWVVITVVLIYMLVRIIAYTPFRRLNEEQIVADAKEDSNFMENIRAIQSIKIFGKEIQRQARWHNYFAESINIGIRSAKLSLFFEVVNSLLFSIENVLIVYLGAKAVISGDISIGMLLAFISYKGQFTGKMSALIDMAIKYKMLSLHLSRVADIAMTEPEKSSDNIRENFELRGSIQLRDVSYRYDETHPYVFENVNFTINPGESVAIIGSSGCGKTTLLKLMIGLFNPTKGKIEIGGKSLQSIGYENYRSQIAAVMQDDNLLSGSLRENISFFDQEEDFMLVEQCAKLAAIHEDIMQMPMGYNSLVGDMGTALSGGQKQRIVLARALYKRPKVLFLDEATSHLDTRLEYSVNSAVKNLDITRIIIAHRPETIKSADRIALLKDGTLREVRFKNKQRKTHNKMVS